MAQPQNAFANTNAPIPSTVLLLDEATRTLFFLPSQSAQPTLASVFYRFEPGTVSRVGSALEKANLTTTPLAERVTHFASITQNKLGHITLDATWGETVLKFFSQAGNFAAALERAQARTQPAWPPVSGFANSTLKNQNGQIFLFSVRDSQNTGILDKIDFVRFHPNGKIVRTYWSRAFNDPTATETAISAIEKASAQFLKLTKELATNSLKLTPQTTEPEAQILIVFSKLIKEREVLLVEKALKEFVKGEPSAMLVPYEISAKEIRYQTPVLISKFTAFSARIKELNPKLTALREHNSNIVTIQEQTLP
jgi:hypothetical protein